MPLTTHTLRSYTHTHAGHQPSLPSALFVVLEEWGDKTILNAEPTARWGGRAVLTWRLGSGYCSTTHGRTQTCTHALGDPWWQPAMQAHGGGRARRGDGKTELDQGGLRAKGERYAFLEWSADDIMAGQKRISPHDIVWQGFWRVCVWRGRGGAVWWLS